MDRFFSKLDLRDIKIDPRGNRFPPDEAGYEPLAPSDEPSHAEHTNGAHPVAVEDLVAAPAALTDEDDWDGPPAYEPLPEPLPEPVAVASAAPAPYADRRACTGDLAGLDEADGDVLKVSARSRPSAVAGAIAGVVREAGRAEVQAIGAGATNQAVKAVAIARDYLRETGIEAICLPAFIDITIDNEDRTAIRLVIEPR